MMKTNGKSSVLSTIQRAECGVQVKKQCVEYNTKIESENLVLVSMNETLDQLALSNSVCW